MTPDYARQRTVPLSLSCGESRVSMAFDGDVTGLSIVLVGATRQSSWFVDVARNEVALYLRTHVYQLTPAKRALARTGPCRKIYGERANQCQQP